MAYRTLAASCAGAAALAAAAWITAAAAPAGSAGATDALVEGFELLEVASIADAFEQLYNERAHMDHDMRPVFTTRFAGLAVTVLMKKEEHREGPPASQCMLDAIDAAAPGSVYVIVLPGGADVAGIGGLMATAMKSRRLAGAISDAGVRDTPQIKRLQFPVFSRGVVPSTSINHYRCAGVNVPVTCAGVRVNPGDIIAADEDGVAVVPRARAAAVLKKAQELDETEHRMYPFIEKFKSIREAVARFGRI